ncbi:MAG: hypothetical protein H5T45_04670 [Thermoplasmatales archaeon]|nr:hypothetical protein [Thermoplasmatales archaeon]
MLEAKDIKRKVDGILKNYLPEKILIPPERAVYEPQSMYDMPKEKADDYRFNAIKYVFKHHYENNKFYRSLCKEKNVTPDDIKNIEDFKKIPLITHKFFKDYPNGREFAIWLANLMSSEVPKVVIKGKNPSYDDVIEAFQEAGVTVCYSSGTTGKFTFIPRDEKTYRMGQYAIARCATEMLSSWYEYDAGAYLLFPNPKKTNIYVGKVTNVLFDLIKDVRVAIDRKITTQLLRISMGVAFTFKEKMMSKLARKASKKMNKKMVEEIISWAEEKNREKARIGFVGAPFILHMVMEEMIERGESFDFGENGAVLTGGGWKIYEDKRMPVKDFRERVEHLFGIPQENCVDLYGMVEANAFMVHCPEAHYLHIPNTYIHPMVLDENGEEVGYGEEGRFAFLDGLALSYPGFMVTGDKVKIHETCPACGRNSPVLEPEIERIKGEEIRGCAEEMRKLMFE